MVLVKSKENTIADKLGSIFNINSKKVCPHIQNVDFDKLKKLFDRDFAKEDKFNNISKSK